jgi:predicted nucleotidyltransferase
MVHPRAIVDLCDRIAEEFRPERIILFGSHAYGGPVVDSDVDLLVVVSQGPDGYRKAAEISDRVRPAFPVDLLVRTTEALSERLAMNDFFLQEVVNNGIVLYDAADARVGREGRERLQQRGATVAGTKDA